jgi:hypothetical protein
MRLLEAPYIVFILLLCFLILILSYSNSLNRNETGYIGASVYFYEAFRYDVFHVNPPLTRYIVGLPILLSTPQYD